MQLVIKIGQVSIMADDPDYVPPGEVVIELDGEKIAAAIGSCLVDAIRKATRGGNDEN